MRFVDETFYAFIRRQLQLSTKPFPTHTEVFLLCKFNADILFSSLE